MNQSRPASNKRLTPPRFWKSIAGSHIAARVMLVLAWTTGIASLGSLLLPQPAHGQVTNPALIESPEYRIQARLDSEAMVLSGTMTVRIPASDPRSKTGDLWFFLPPNRFAVRDPRGNGKSLESIPFESLDYNFDLDYKVYPDGFSSGEIEILGVADGEGRPLVNQLFDNPTLPVGDHTGRGLLKIKLPPGEAEMGRRVVLNFRTRLPQRYWEGWSEAGVLLEYWHPVLANLTQGEWNPDFLAPRSGRYALRVTSNKRWRVLAGAAYDGLTGRGSAMNMPLQPTPMRSLPLLFLDHPLNLETHDYDLSLYSYYQPGFERVARLSHRIASSFVEYLKAGYGLRPPFTRMALVQVKVPPGDMRTVGGMVLIPDVNYRNHPVLNRVFLADLTRAMGKIWFGETLWAHEDKDAWLPLGLSGYLALDFFNLLYGWDAGIHNIADWLKPRFREHYFESPVREQIRGGEDHQLNTPLRNPTNQGSTLVTLFNKSPLVIRTLSHVVGHEVFRKRLNAFYYGHRFKAVGLPEFSETFTENSEKPLDWFFRMWWEETPLLDFSIKNWSEEPRGAGVLLKVELARNTRLPAPVEVLVEAENGESRTLRWEDDQPTSVLEFSLKAPMKRVVIDPGEYWLEADRKNNHSTPLVRVRPLFDWSKQREMLVTMQGRMGGNAIDGNYVGLGVRITLDEYNTVEMIPIYGDKTGWSNYELSWKRDHLFFKNFNTFVGVNKLKGTQNGTLGLDYLWLDTDAGNFGTNLTFNYSTVDAAIYTEGEETISQPESNNNNFKLKFDFRLWKDSLNDTLGIIDWMRSRQKYGSNYHYDSIGFGLSQNIFLSHNNSLGMDVFRGSITGQPPVQNKFLLGGPNGLRGYPRETALAYDHISIARANLYYTFSRAALGSLLQSRRFTAMVFTDVGKGWNQQENQKDVRIRRDVGVGLSVDVNLLKMTEFPILLQVGVPVGDEEYTKPRYILFGELSF